LIRLYELKSLLYLYCFNFSIYLKVLANVYVHLLPVADLPKVKFILKPTIDPPSLSYIAKTGCQFDGGYTVPLFEENGTV
jgi:hypothetical protein